MYFEHNYSMLLNSNIICLNVEKFLDKKPNLEGVSGVFSQKLIIK